MAVLEDEVRRGQTAVKLLVRRLEAFQADSIAAFKELQRRLTALETHEVKVEQHQQAVHAAAKRRREKHEQEKQKRADLKVKAKLIISTPRPPCPPACQCGECDQPDSMLAAVADSEKSVYESRVISTIGS